VALIVTIREIKPGHALDDEMRLPRPEYWVDGRRRWQVSDI